MQNIVESKYKISNWQWVVADVLTLCLKKEKRRPSGELKAFLDKIEQTDDWQGVATAIQRILDGERDILALRLGLNTTEYVIVHMILAQLAEAEPQPSEVSRQPEHEGVSLDDLLAMVAQACAPGGPPGLGEQLYAFTRTLSSDPNAPPEVRALGGVLNRVLSGERAPDLSGLSPEFARAVQEMMDVIRNT